jgi:hypothetical protein|tara:strand:+ start:192 stop:380 length:189 start_codon:yes stop_codon:yes gene_type:complete
MNEYSQKRIEWLTKRHREIDNTILNIDDSLNRGERHQSMIRELKRQKLKIKDEISLLEKSIV